MAPLVHLKNGQTRSVLEVVKLTGKISHQIHIRHHHPLLPNPDIPGSSQVRSVAFRRAAALLWAKRLPQVVSVQEKP